jgi:hypothetical protein
MSESGEFGNSGIGGNVGTGRLGTHLGAIAAVFIAVIATTASAQSIPSATLASTMSVNGASLGGGINLAGNSNSALLAEPATVRSLQGSNPALILPLGERARLVYEPRPQTPLQQAGIETGPSPEHRVGLEFKGTSAAGDVRNLLRVQLAGDSALHFRPRGGGLNVSWRAKF